MKDTGDAVLNALRGTHIALWGGEYGTEAPIFGSTMKLTLRG